MPKTFCYKPIIRNVTAKDFAAITAIYAHSVESDTASFEVTAPSETEMGVRIDGLIKKGFPFIVAECNGEMAGYAYAGPYRTRSAYGKTAENSVYVAKHWQGVGIGPCLLEQLIQRLDDAGFREIIAVIGGVDNLTSIRMHEKLGFIQCGHLRGVGHKHGQWVDTILLQYRLENN